MLANDPILHMDLYSNKGFSVSIAETGEVIGRVEAIYMTSENDVIERRVVFSERVKNYPEPHGRAVAALLKAGFVVEYKP